jgi:hypothetical protein
MEKGEFSMAANSREEAEVGQENVLFLRCFIGCWDPRYRNLAMATLWS